MLAGVGMPRVRCMRGGYDEDGVRCQPSQNPRSQVRVKKHGDGPGERAGHVASSGWAAAAGTARAPPELELDAVARGSKSHYGKQHEFFLYIRNIIFLLYFSVSF